MKKRQASGWTILPLSFIKEMETYERKAGPHERPKGKGRTEALILPAPGENAGSSGASAQPSLFVFGDSQDWF